jgi:hypothetical protein
MRRRPNLQRWIRCRRCGLNMKVQLEVNRFTYPKRCSECGQDHQLEFEPNTRWCSMPGRLRGATMLPATKAQWGVEGVA